MLAKLKNNYTRKEGINYESWLEQWQQMPWAQLGNIDKTEARCRLLVFMGFCSENTLYILRNDKDSMPH